MRARGRQRRYFGGCRFRVVGMLAVFVVAGYLTYRLGVYLEKFGGTAVGDRVVVNQAVAVSRGGDPDAFRDDELLYGMTAVVTGKPRRFQTCLAEADNRYPLRLRRETLLAGNDAVDAWRRDAGHVVVAPFADVVGRPSLQAFPPLLTLPRGSRLAVVETAGDYFAVKLADGARGFVRRPALRSRRTWGEVDEAATRRRLADDARAYLGTPYRWGGKTPGGIDCSGLAAMVYDLNGLPIHRNASAPPGHPVALMHLPAPGGRHTPGSLAAARPGDLVYWPGHMGIYLGDGDYIHANATSHDVRINSLYDTGDADGGRPDLADAAGICTWGTAFPAEPERLTVRALTAAPCAGPDGEAGWYRFFARVDGYAPTRGVLYPEGEGEGKPAIPVADPYRMVHDLPSSEHEAIPRYRYPGPGRYVPAVSLVNETGWRPNGRSIAGGVYAAAEPVVVE